MMTPQQVALAIGFAVLGALILFLLRPGRETSAPTSVANMAPEPVMLTPTATPVTVLPTPVFAQPTVDMKRLVAAFMLGPSAVVSPTPGAVGIAAPTVGSAPTVYSAPQGAGQPKTTTLRSAQIQAPKKPSIQTILQAKQAYRAGRIDKATYRNIVERLEEDLDMKVRQTKALYRDGQITKDQYRSRISALKLRYIGQD